MADANALFRAAAHVVAVAEAERIRGLGKVPIADIRAWAERHDIQGSDTTLRCIFEDAQTGVPSVTAGPNSPDGEQR